MAPPRLRGLLCVRFARIFMFSSGGDDKRPLLLPNTLGKERVALGQPSKDKCPAIPAAEDVLKLVPPRSVEEELVVE